MKKVVKDDDSPVPVQHITICGDEKKCTICQHSQRINKLLLKTRIKKFNVSK